MKKLLMLATAAMLVAGPAKAAVVLGIETIPDPTVVPQSLSSPCVICATNQAHNPVGFGFNNFDSTGNDSSFNLFSSNITGSFANGDNVTVTPYTDGQLAAFLSGLGDVSLQFGVAMDVNSTGAKSEVLEVFQLIDMGAPGLGDEVVLFELAGPFATPQIHNGNGKADYLITGFNLTGLNSDTRLLFRAQWSGAVDGGESFYIVPVGVVLPPEVPLPAAVWLFGSALAGGAFMLRRRKNKVAAQVAA